ncbi:hypothetical protein RF11_10361 [Thelohanellus kitauei]|uniref:Uncharacterized protein n=1 Tax=Thelohanellus kitauei TaxID=669202 RepID=A0A0C2ML93_THEKT|nr:hypothetical protein RF11_10361 [Thelohanellus kitauei]
MRTKYHYFVENQTYTHFAHEGYPFRVIVKDVLEISQEEYIELIKSDVAKTELLLPFQPTYLCKMGVYSLLYIMSKYNGRHDAEDDVGFDIGQTITSKCKSR